MEKVFIPRFVLLFIHVLQHSLDIYTCFITSYFITSDSFTPGTRAGAAQTASLQTQEDREGAQ